MITARPTSGAQGTEEEEPPLDLVSNRQPILYHDELVRRDGGPVPTKIIHFL